MSDRPARHSVAGSEPLLEDVRRWLSAIVDSSDDAIISKNLDGTISTWNPAAERLFGYSAQEAVGQSISLIIPAELHGEEEQILRRLRAGERIEHHETRRITRDGRCVDVSLSISPVRDGHGKIIGAAKILRDITEKKRAEEALRESEERFRLIANTVPVAIWIADASKQCTYVNQRWLDLTGRPFEAALGTGWKDRIHPEDIERIWIGYATAFDRREPFQVEYRVRGHDGEYRWVLANGVPRYSGSGSFAGYIGSATDVTERKMVEEALSRVGRRLIEAQEEERARLARELHDDINQRLFLLSMNLGLLMQSDAGSETERIRQIEQVRAEVIDLVKDVQSLSHRLHPPRLEYLGIAEAAAALCAEISRQQGIEVCFHAESVPEGVPRRIVVCLYRVLQEGLHNAIKHSDTSKVEVLLRGRAGQIELRIDDFGVGFDVEATQGCGLGLTSMRERVKAVNGQFFVRSKPERGTSILACVPALEPSEAVRTPIRA